MIFSVFKITYDPGEKVDQLFQCIVDLELIQLSPMIYSADADGIFQIGWNRSDGERRSKKCRNLNILRIPSITLA